MILGWTQCHKLLNDHWPKPSDVNLRNDHWLYLNYIKNFLDDHWQDPDDITHQKLT
jgi:hypothetical protein